jgi:hypothetical protein
MFFSPSVKQIDLDLVSSTVLLCAGNTEYTGMPKEANPVDCAECL